VSLAGFPAFRPAGRDAGSNPFVKGWRKPSGRAMMSAVLASDEHHLRGVAPMPGVSAEPPLHREDPK